jgi:YesN/AraC family two-component response regulator
MIHTLIVDDEIFVRKGLISVMPWDKFGFKIVGEAGNGERALEFLRTCRADVVFTDLTMPGMSGFEFMKAMREQFPETKAVVLTCHQNFSFVQDALRLGAIDYIVKTQLEMEKTEVVLGRIADRIRQENKDRPDFIPVYTNEHGKMYSEEVISGIRKAVEYINENLLSGFNQEEVAKAANLSRGYFSICFRDIVGKTFGDYVRSLKIQKAEELLKTTNKQIYWIADQLGFQDDKYFSRIFREQVGCTPSEFREQSRRTAAP